MRPLDSPFREADRLLAGLPREVKVVVVDFHAEATSEKLAMGFHLDGRASLVVGTHTHVPTADERVLPNGTAFLCDVGMTGPYESIIGFNVERVLHRFLMHTPSSFEVAKRDVRLAAVLVEVDEGTGRARAIQRLLLPEGAKP
jgi:metallophosphoesterase (TIGR00282 family)